MIAIAAPGIKPIRYNITPAETQCINGLLDDYVNRKNQAALMTATGVGTRNKPQNLQLFTTQNLQSCDAPYLLDHIKNNFTSPGCDKNAERKQWMISGMEARVKSMLNPKKRVRLAKSETIEAKVAREEKERCKKLRVEKEASEGEKEKNLRNERLRIKNEVVQLLLNIGEYLLGQIAEDNKTIEYVHHIYLELEGKRVSMMNHINLDNNIATVYNDVLRSLKELYALSYDRKWNWGIDLRKIRDEIMNRPEAIILVPEANNRSWSDIANDTSLNYDDRGHALSMVAKINLDTSRIKRSKIHKAANVAINALNNYDEARTLHVKLFKKEEITYSNGSGKRIFSETNNNLDVEDTNCIRIVEEEKENLKRLLSEVKVTVERIKDHDPTCVAIGPTFFGAFTCETKQLMDPLLEPKTESANSKLFASFLNEIFISMFGIKAVKIIIPRKKQNNKSNDALN